MRDHALSDALRTYIWGNTGLPWPSERPEALRPDQQRFLPAIRSIIATAFGVDPSEGTLSEVAERAEAAVRAQHPELTGEAVRAVGNLCSYQWR